MMQMQQMKAQMGNPMKQEKTKNYDDELGLGGLGGAFTKKEKINMPTYLGYDEWIILSETIKEKEFRPLIVFSKMISDKGYDIKDVDILNHEITQLVGSEGFWVMLTIGFKPKKIIKKGF